MLNRQWRITHHHFHKHHLKSQGQGNQSKRTRTRTQPTPENRCATHNPQSQRLSSFRESKRYNSKDYEGRIRQKISNCQSSQRFSQKETKENLEVITVKLPKIVVTETPIKIQTLSVKKDFVFNFYRKGKCLLSRGKKNLENTIT